MKTPPEVLDTSVLYFRIYFLGSLFNLLYNMGAGILQAVGDSRRPLIFLCISSVTNIVLDLLFVAGFHMGVDGVAWATIISQFVSAVLVMSALMRTKDIYRLELRKIKIDKRMMKRDSPPQDPKRHPAVHYLPLECGGAGQCQYFRLHRDGRIRGV